MSEIVSGLLKVQIEFHINGLYYCVSRNQSIDHSYEHKSIVVASLQFQVLRKDCAKLQKVLRRHDQQADENIETLKSELAREKSVQEEKIRAEVEDRTQALSQEMDS